VTSESCCSTGYISRSKEFWRITQEGFHWSGSVRIENRDFSFTVEAEIEKRGAITEK
jgi:predicted transcriptional regulator